MERWRRLLCLVAALLAAFAGVLATIDKELFGQGFIAAGLFLMAIAAAAFAVWPTRSDWSGRRRTLAALTALAWTLLAGPVLLYTIVVSGCACSPGEPAYVAPAPLGIDTRHWIALALASGPILLLIAAALPGRDAALPPGGPPSTASPPATRD